MGVKYMYRLCTVVNICCISIFLTCLLNNWTTIGSLKDMKNIKKFILSFTIVIFKVIYIFNVRNATMLVKNYNTGFFMIFATDIVIFLLMYMVLNKKS